MKKKTLNPDAYDVEELTELLWKQKQRILKELEEESKKMIEDYERIQLQIRKNIIPTLLPLKKALYEIFDIKEDGDE